MGDQKKKSKKGVDKKKEKQASAVFN